MTIFTIFNLFIKIALLFFVAFVIFGFLLPLVFPKLSGNKKKLLKLLTKISLILLTVFIILITILALYIFYTALWQMGFPI